MPEDRGRLLKLLGVAFGIAVSVGGTVGVGILRTPGLVAAQLHEPSLILAFWVIGALYALVGTLCVLELGAALPSAGGWYVYARRAFGDATGFSVGWIDWLAQCSSLAYLAVSIGDFSASLWPSVAGATKAIAAGSLIAFAVIQWLGLRSSAWTQQATSLLKGALLVGLVALCLMHPAAPVAPAAVHPGLGIAAVIVVLQAIIVTYDGWYTVIYFAEEDVDPGRNLPRGALGGLAVTVVLYLLVNVALLHVLGADGLAASSLPAADAAQLLFGGSGGAIVTALSLASLLSVVNAVLMLATRILFAISRDGLFAAWANDVNAAGTPVPAMVLTTMAACALVLTGTFEQLLAVAAVLLVAVYVSGFVALIVLRRSEPALARPFRTPGHPWTAVVAIVASLAFLAGNISADPRSSAWSLGLLAASYPVYRFFARR
jgi:APA family basic amino acid/polyamine antiporter